MQPFDFLTKLTPSGPEKIPPRDQSRRNDEIVRSVIRRNAEGNVLLSRGKTLTATDKECDFAGT